MHPNKNNGYSFFVKFLEFQIHFRIVYNLCNINNEHNIINIKKDRIMKKFFLVAFTLFVALSNVKADERDRLITKEQLPAAAQSLLTTHFSNLKISLVKEDREFISRNYEVIFTDGTKVEFTRNGEWKELDCRKDAVPAALIPAEIKNFVTERYPDAKILQIDRDNNDYEIKLSNKLELTFDKKFNIIDIDD